MPDINHLRLPSSDSRAFVPRLLITGQLCNSLVHLFVSIDLETLVLSHAGELDVFLVQLLFHNLLQRLQDQRLGLRKRQGAMVFILQLCLRTLASGTDGLCVVSVERTRRLGVISKFTS